MHNHNHVTSICLWCLRFLCRKKCSQVGAWSCSRDCPVAQMRCRTVDDSSRKHCSTRKIVWNPLPLSARIFDVLDCPVQLPSKCPLYISVLGGSWGKPTHCPFSEVESDSSRLQWLQLFHDSLKDRIRSASSATVSTSLSSMQSTPICCKTCHCCTAPKFPDFPTLTLLPIDIYWLSKFAAGFFLTDTAWDSTKCPMRHFAITSSVAKMFRGIWWSKSDLENEFQLAHPFCNLLWLVWLACVTSNLYFFLQLQIHRIHSWSPRRNRDRVDNLLARNPSKTSNSTSWTLVLQREETLKSLNRLEFDMTDLIILMIFDLWLSLISQWYLCFIPVAQALIILGSDIRATPCAAQRSTTLHLSQLSSISSICSMLSACRNLARLWYPVTQYCTKSIKCTWQSAISMSPAGQVQSLNSQQVKLSSLALTDVCWNALLHASAKSSSHMFTAQINLYSASAWVAVTQVVLQKWLLQIASFCMETWKTRL